MADDIYSLLMGSSEPSVAEQAKAMSAALRRKRGIGELAMLTGDPVLGQFGQTQIGGAAQQEGLLGSAGEQRLAKSTALLQQQRGLGAQAREGGLDRALKRELGLMELDANKIKAELAAKKQVLDVAEGLRKEVSGNPVTRRYMDATESFGKVQAAAKRLGVNPNPVDDVALIYGFMKTIDPSAAVQEGDKANASNTTNVPGWVLNRYNQALLGTGLNDQQRADFVAAARKQHAVHQQAYDGLTKQYRGLAERQGADPKHVVLGGEAEPSPAIGQPAAPSWGPELEKELNDLLQRRGVK